MMDKDRELTAETPLEARIKLIYESIKRSEVKLARDRRKLRELTLRHI